MQKTMHYHYLADFPISCIHFDNCCGQNKNNVVVQYAMWRVMTGLHQQLELAMMITGHTKFHPDWHFGVWKCRYRCHNSNAETMDQVAQTVRDSSRNSHNIPQLVNDEQKPVLFLQWKLYLSQYFKPMKPLKNLSKFHHFSMRSDRPGIVQCKVLTDSPPVDVNILKKDFVLTPAMPEPMPQSGLDLQRQWYLYEQIRDFCSSKCAKDICCPKPTAPKQVSQIPIETKTLKTVNQKRKQSLLM